MKKRLKYFAYALNYLVRTAIFREETPFIGGLVINEKCNLKCRHCVVANRGLPDLKYGEIDGALRAFYKKGIRSVFLEGGEPFLWRDGGRKLEDVVKLARCIGFHLVSVYTNGTFPIEVSTDSVFVSLDGLTETNDKLRGPCFHDVIKNIKASRHPNIIVNFTINSVNQTEIEEFCREMRAVAQVKGVFFYFHTPYYGVDELFVGLEKKEEHNQEDNEPEKSGL